MFHNKTVGKYGRLPEHNPGKNEPCRNSKEVAEMFGFANSTSLQSSVQNGSFPEPDLVVGDRIKKLYWRISTLEKEMKRRLASDSKRVLRGESHA